MGGKYEHVREEQREIARRVSLKNRFQSLDEITTIASADISCNRFSKTGYAAVIVFSYPALHIVEQQTCVDELPIPYIPGLLSFREAPLIQSCLDQLTTPVQILICDGQGIAHPRRCGIASYLGVKNDLVTVGCGKSRLIGEYDEPDNQKGSLSDLTDNHEKIGEVVRTRDGVKPLFISPGHGIDFELSTQLILSLCPKYRQPMPIQAVHHLVNKIRVEAH